MTKKAGSSSLQDKIYVGGETFGINFNTFNLCVKNLMMM